MKRWGSRNSTFNAIMTEQELKNTVVSVIRKRLKHPHYRVFLFGSRAWKTARENSDYDIGIECVDPLTLDDLADIRLELNELPVMQKMDVVDFGRTTEEFQRVAKERMEILYEQ